MRAVTTISHTLSTSSGNFPGIIRRNYTEERSPGVIMHGEFRIGPAVIMFADASEQYPAFPASMFLYVDDVDAVFARALARPDVQQLQELDNRSYGRGGGFKDAFGNAWWVNSPA